jgi:hypothetical protein
MYKIIGFPFGYSKPNQIFSQIAFEIKTITGLGRLARSPTLSKTDRRLNTETLKIKGFPCLFGCSELPFNRKIAFG